jgi:DNA repair photolyase
VKSRDVSNPLSRFAKTAVEYDDGEGPPPAQVTLLEDHSRSILSRNDSPDLGFRWSANPYRGCLHACSYCLGPDTEVLLADRSTRRIADLLPGDEICGTTVEGRHRRYVRTRVLDHWMTRKPAHRIELSTGTELVASADHRFLARDGWRFVGDGRRPGLTTEDTVMGGPLESIVDGAFVGEHGRVVSIEPVGEQTLYDITTGTGDFIANGVISHNCYARPHHEYLDMGAGTDFDTKIVVKPRAAELLREAFDDRKWKGELVMFSGVTDCYQAIEAKLGITRACLEVCLEYRNPVSIISKSALVERDASLLAELAREAGCHVNVSLAWIDAEDARAIEPWAASPERRLKVIETLARAGVPVGIMCAPIIPGLNDGQIPKLLERARDAGAQWAGWTLLRLPGAVAQVFPERLRAAMPLSAEKVLHRINETRGGGTKMNDARFHSRFRGQGAYAETIAMLFRTTAERLGLRPRGDLRPDEIYEVEPPTKFRRPPPRTGQLALFPE